MRSWPGEDNNWCTSQVDTKNWGSFTGEAEKGKDRRYRGILAGSGNGD